MKNDIKNTEKNYNNMDIGDKVLVSLEEGHVIIDYVLIVDVVETCDFEKDDDGNIYKIAFGHGETKEDEELAEEYGHLISRSNFVKFVED